MHAFCFNKLFAFIKPLIPKHWLRFKGKRGLGRPAWNGSFND
jgi:hypothetical protein